MSCVFTGHCESGVELSGSPDPSRRMPELVVPTWLEWRRARIRPCIVHKAGFYIFCSRLPSKEQRGNRFFFRFLGKESNFLCLCISRNSWKAWARMRPCFRKHREALSVDVRVNSWRGSLYFLQKCGVYEGKPLPQATRPGNARRGCGLDVCPRVTSGSQLGDDIGKDESEFFPCHASVVRSCASLPLKLNGESPEISVDHGGFRESCSGKACEVPRSR